MDKELSQLLDVLPVIDFESSSLAEVRSAMESIVPPPPQPQDLGVIETETCTDGDHENPPVKLYVYRPSAPEVAAAMILHIHGGGFVSGSASHSREANMRLAAALNAVVVSVDYRLAPESRYPQPLEDCYAALKWLHDHAGKLGGDRSRIALSGESAGAGLAAALALLARDRGEIHIIHQHLIYPMLDDRTGGKFSPVTGTGEYVWTARSNQFGWASLLGEANPETASYAVPSRAKDLNGLPPAFISVGALDLFVREDLEYARRMMEAGVTVEFHVYPGGFHGFDLAPEAHIAIEARRASLLALKRALHYPVA